MPTQINEVALVVLGVLIAALFIPLIWFIATYNRFIRLRQHIKESWADVDVELRRRHDLIPNLVQTVKAYAAHERELFEHVVKLRAAAMAPHASRAALSTDESALGGAVGRVVALAEAYPTLKADSAFLNLQRELSLTEDRIAAARRFFNANVRELNQLCATIPSSLVAGMFSFKPEDFFQATEAQRAVPLVELGGGRAT